MHTVLGVERKQGDFKADNGQHMHYDNLVMHCVNDDKVSTLIQGVRVESVKIKMAILDSCFGGLVSDQIGDLASLVGMSFNLFFDRFGNCVKADPVDTPKEGGVKT